MEFQQFTDAYVKEFESLCDYSKTANSEDNFKEQKTNNFCLNVDKKVSQLDSGLTKLNNANRILHNQLTTFNITSHNDFKNISFDIMPTINDHKKTNKIDQKKVNETINNAFTSAFSKKDFYHQIRAEIEVYEMAIIQLIEHSKRQAKGIALPASLVPIEDDEKNECNRLIEDLRNL